MGLSSIFRSKAAAAPEAADRGSPDAVQQARTRARRRLVGAGVLLLAGIVGFPLLFETQPRPIAVDIPIEIPRRDAVEPLALPAPREAAAPAEPVRPEPAKPAPETAAAPPAEQPTAHAPAAPPKNVAATRTAPAEPAPAARADTDEAARARALLEGRSAKRDPASAGGERYVVQVGAFADAASAGAMRKKVEKLGLKTYTQEVDTSAGKRIRVRTGPYGSREEADKALAKAKAAGLAAVVLTL